MGRKGVWRAADPAFQALLAEFAEDDDEQRARGLAWRSDALASWTTSAILWRLAELGISPEEESLREDARSAGTPYVLAALWRCQAGPDRLAREFVTFAADEVWRRFLPEGTRGEMEMLLVSDLAIEDQCRERPTTPEELRRRYDAAMAVPRLAAGFMPDSLPDAFHDLQTLVIAPVTTWAAELAPALAQAGLVEEAQSLCLAWAPLDARERFLAERAVILAEAGREEEADAQIDQLLKDYPRSTATQVYVAEALLALGDVEESHAALERAKSFASSSEERKWATEHMKAILDRAMDLADKEASRQAWEDEEEGLEPLDEEVGIPLVREEAKVGRNDPCPCGSGKKYKKCCGSTK